MKALFENLKALFAQTGAGTRVVIGVALLAVLGVAGVSWYQGSTPHFVVLFSNLEPNEAARMTSALAGADIRFQLSQPPAPHVLYVDGARYFEAHNAIALAGASSKPTKGIQTGGSGASSVFEGVDERAQKSLKRDWEEMEKQLEVLDFVADATVTTSIPDRSAFRRDTPQTIAVTLSLRGGGDLSREQARTVAKLVRYRFDVPQENVIIADQNGRSLWDSDEGGGMSGQADPLESKARYESELEAKANEVLAQVLGVGRARVLVHTEWRWDQTESIQEIVDPDKKAVISQQESKSETSEGSGPGVGGVVGTAANLLDEFGGGGSQAGSLANGEGPKSKTSDKRTETLVGRETKHLVSTVPVVDRMSVSLFLDESHAERLDSLRSSVQAAVGFVESRDSFSSMVVPFASLPRDEEGKLVAPVEPVIPAPPSPILTLLLQHGVEIVAALAFVIVLLKALKSDKSAKSTTTATRAGQPAGSTASADDDLDDEELERLAIAQIEELVKSDPERVSEILSRWALQGAEAEAAAR